MNLDYVGVDNASRAFLITSVKQTEGKSVVATNLALMMAQSGQKVILVDADFRKPSIHTYLGLDNEKGLSDLFRSDLEVEDVIVPAEQDCLRIITLGASAPNPSDLVGSRKMDGIISDIRERAEIVVLDGPPALITDAMVLSTKVDAVVLVVGYGITRKNEAQIAVKQLHRANATIAGIVMNKIPPNNKNILRLYHYYSEEDGEKPKPSLVLEKLGLSRLNFSIRNPLKPKSS
jgi:capsular exopolysaccharide synthesis family protein